MKKRRGDIWKSCSFFIRKLFPEPYRDGGGEGGLGQNVRQGAAVEVVAQHVLAVLVGVQFPGLEDLAEDCLLVGDVDVVRSVSTSKHEPS